VFFYGVGRTIDQFLRLVVFDIRAAKNLPRKLKHQLPIRNDLQKLFGDISDNTGEIVAAVFNAYQGGT